MPVLSQCNIAFLSLVLPILLTTITAPAILGANILAVFPSVWKSHYLFGRAILQELVTNHHHNVTLISAFQTTATETSQLPHNNNGSDNQHNQLTEIRIEGIEQNWLEMGLSLQIDQMHEKSIMERFTRMIYAGASAADLVLGSKPVRELLRSNASFDLLIVDMFLSDALLGFSQFYKVPTVVLSPTGPNTWLNQMTGNPQNSALDSSNFLPYLERMTFWERSVNTLMGLFEKLTYNFFHMISQEAVYEKHFEALAIERDGSLPHYKELTQNISLVLMNSHPVVQYPRSFLPNMIEVGGVHLREEKLPEHLAKFIEDSEDGVIYVNFGANVRTSELSEQKLDILLHAFETLSKSMRVLLKWETQKLNYQAGNVFTSDWFPQQAVLAHPKVKLFISAAGVMSVIEAIHYRTPMIAIPILPEQEVNAKRLENRGCAIHLPFADLNYDSLFDAIDEALSNSSSLVTNIGAASILLNEHLTDPMSRAIYHIHMVLKTSGAAHLKSHANHLGFFKTELVDVLLIILAGVCVIIAVPFLVICAILRRSYTSGQRAEPIVRRRRSSESAKLRREEFRKSISGEM